MTPSALLAIADRLEPAMRYAFMDAIRLLGQRIDVDALAEAAINGQMVTADMLIDTAALPADLQRAVDTLTLAFNEAAHAAAAKLPIGAVMRFDAVNPLAVAAARAAAADLIVGVDASVRAAIRASVEQALVDGLTRRQLSQLIRPIIGLTPQQARAVMAYRQSLIDLELRSEIVARRSADYAMKKLRERARTIARTELITAANRGARAAWSQAQQEGLLPATVKRRWTVTPDDRLCQRCMAMDGQTVGINEPFTSPEGLSVPDPGLHPNCRCVAVIEVPKIPARLLQRK